jgi:hypothetical protein
MSDEPDDAQPVDRPQDLPAQQSAVDKAEAKKRESKKQLVKRQLREWFTEQMRNPVARQFFWDILNAAGTFEEKYGFGPYGQPNDLASYAEVGRKELGLRLYHSWSQLDRAGVLGLLDEFHPTFEGK